MSQVDTFRSRFDVARFADASFFASELFQEAFASAFPVPVEAPAINLREPISKQDWFQYVAFYRWPGGLIEPVGFVNYIRYGSVYLAGGLCVKRNFYHRLPREHFQQCRALGGVAQLLLETVADDRRDAEALFGYVGDAKSMRVSTRAGYALVRAPYLIAKWPRDLPQQRRAELIDRVASIGPF